MHGHVHGRINGNGRELFTHTRDLANARLGPLVIPMFDNLTEQNTAAYLIRGQNGIIDCLYQVDGLRNLLPQAATATKKHRYGCDGARAAPF